MTSFDTLVIVNYGGPQALDLARRIRAKGLFSLVLLGQDSLETLPSHSLKGLLLMGQNERNEYPIERQLLTQGVPILALGALASPLLIKAGFSPTSQRSLTEAQHHKIWVETEEDLSDQKLEEFLFTICQVTPSWSASAFVTAQLEAIKAQVGSQKVLLGLSGGVDSSVAAALLHQAIGNQLESIFIDTGLMRQNEAKQVVAMFGSTFGTSLRHIQAEELFLAALRGKTEAEEKRKLIGKRFVEIFEREAQTGGPFTFLAQGTLYSDVIESQGSSSGAIKSHHNVGGLPEKLNLKLLEPFRYLFKDEVRLVGKELALPDELLYRHPFPGPGLAVRCIGEVTKERLETLRKVDAIFMDELRKANLYHSVWQALATLLPIRSVGVRNQQRTFLEVCTLRAVNSVDAMQATACVLPPELLQATARRISAEVPEVSRVLYDLTDKPPGTIEWE